MNQPTYLFHDPGQGALLESNTGIPLRSQWAFHATLELRFGGEGERQVFNEVFSSLLVPLFGDDDVFLVVVSTSGGIDACDLLYPLRFWWCLAEAGSAP